MPNRKTQMRRRIHAHRGFLLDRWISTDPVGFGQSINEGVSRFLRYSTTPDFLETYATPMKFKTSGPSTFKGINSLIEKDVTTLSVDDDMDIQDGPLLNIGKEIVKFKFKSKNPPIE